LARAEPGLESPPPQADKPTLRKRINPRKQFTGAGNRQIGATDGGEKANPRRARAVSGLPETIVIADLFPDENMMESTSL
jgi:hypothetical protein